MKALVYVALGGALGAVSRHALGGWVLHHAANARLPIAMLSVNVVGCFVAGLLAGMVGRQAWLSADAQLFLFVGVLGGFTTFSAFGVETLALVRKGDVGIAAAYVVLSVGLAVAAVFAGFAATSLTTR